MAENLVANGVTYNGVEAVEFENTEGKQVPYYPDAVRYNPQALTEAQKTQARDNIGAVSEAQLSEAIADKVSKTGITLGLHSDGKYYIFVDGAPVGTGFELSGNSGDVFGYVDENNNIVLNGNLADGSYSIKYEMEDDAGNIKTIDIGDLVLDSNVYYTVTNNLTNCTNSNSATQAVGGQAYTATITADSGYELSSVTVTMGGNPVTVSGGSISIADVTGNIVITAAAEEIKAAEPVTVDVALTDGIRIGSDGGDRTLAGFCATEMIDLRSIPKPCTINLIKAKWASDGTTTTVRYYVANASGSALANGVTTEGSFDYFTVADNSSNYSNITVTVTSDNVGYIRFSGQWAISGISDSSSKFADAGTKATLTYTPAS